MNIKRIVSVLAIALPAFTLHAQDNLVNALKANPSDSSKQKFHFTPVIDLANTSVKNQGSSGTCWSYSTTSFLESEMIKACKQPVDLSEVYYARGGDSEKGINYG